MQRRSAKLQKNQIESQKLQGNNKQIQNKYRTKGTTRQKKDKKQKQNREKQIQTKKIVGVTPGHELAENC
jgi:hypothetical protein